MRVKKLSDSTIFNGNLSRGLKASDTLIGAT